MESLDELRQTRLWKYLSEVDSNYAQHALDFVELITPILASINEYFPYYTRHDAHHGYRVVRRMEQIVEIRLFDLNYDKRFTRAEVLLLICSAYAHDLGMAIFPGEEEELLSKLGIEKIEGWKTNPVLQNYLRKDHSIRGANFLNNHYEKSAIPQNLLHLLNELMRSHNLTTHQLEVELSNRVAADEREIDLKQLATILCIGDALEFSDTRVMDGVIDKLRNNTDDQALNTSYLENMKHVAIGDSVAIGEDGKVIFTGTFNDPAVLSLAHNTVDYIENWIQQYCDIEFRSIYRKLRIRPDLIDRNFKSLNFDFERIGVRIKKENIINLIASDSTWSSDETISIKELLQNAVEACRYRDFHTPAARKYKPRIIITCNSELRQIIVEDNGCGMTRNIVLNNFLTLGNSRSGEAGYSANGYYSLARFGIGFWSTFTIAKEVDIETAPYELLQQSDLIDKEIESLLFSVSIDEFKDYTTFTKGKKVSGTRIKLKLKDKVNVPSLFSRIVKIVQCSEIEIEIKLDNNSFSVPKRLSSPSDSNFFGARLKYAQENELKLWSFANCDNDLDFYLSLAYRIREDGKATFLLKGENASLMNAIEGPHHFPTISILGFNAPIPIKYSCFAVSRVGQFGANIFNPKGFKFRLDRRTLLPSEEFTTYSQKITNSIHIGYRKFLVDNNSYDAETIYKLNSQSEMHGGNVYDQYTGKELEYALENFSDLLCIKLVKVENGKAFQECDVEYETVKNILSKDYTLWSIQNFIHFRGHTIRPEDALQLLYNFILSLKKEGENHFIIEANRVGSMLFDNDPSSHLFRFNLQFPHGITGVPLMIINTKNVDVKTVNHDKNVGIQGQWAGAVYYKNIGNSLYGFSTLGRYRIVVQPGTKLAHDLSGYFNDNNIFALASLIAKLGEAESGHVDSSVQEYLK